MSEQFTLIDREEYRTSGGGGQAGRGVYPGILLAFAQTGQPFAMITTDNAGNMPGKKAASIATALKNAKKSDNAPEAVKSVKITSRGPKESDGEGSLGVVFLENESVAADES